MCPRPATLRAPLQAQGKDVRALRSLYYLAEVYVSCGSAGTPTLYDPSLRECLAAHPWLSRWVAAGVLLLVYRVQCLLSRTVCGSGAQADGVAPVGSTRGLHHAAILHLGVAAHATCHSAPVHAVGKRPDDKALQAVLGEVGRVLETPALDPAVARASLFLAAAAARSNPAARKQLVAAVQRAIAEADEAASAGGPLAPGKSPRRRSAATDWDLQHSVFAASRAGGAATGADEVSRSFGVGVGSADAVGARHALAMGLEVAFRVSPCRLSGPSASHLLPPTATCAQQGVVPLAVCGRRMQGLSAAVSTAHLSHLSSSAGLAMQDAGYVVREVYEAVAEAAQHYEASGPSPPRVPGAQRHWRALVRRSCHAAPAIALLLLVDCRNAWPIVQQILPSQQRPGTHPMCTPCVTVPSPNVPCRARSKPGGQLCTALPGTAVRRGCPV